MIQIRKTTLISGGLVLAVISFFVPIVALAGLLVIGTVVLGKPKVLSTVETLIITLLSILASSITLYSLITLLHLHLPVQFVLPLQYLMTLIAIWRWPKKTISYQPTIKRSDVAALAVSVITFGLLLIPIINQSGGYIAQFLAFGEDNASHYALVNYVYHHGSYSYNETSDQAGLLKSLEIYPQGFHLSAGVLLTTARPINLTEAGLIKLYAILIAFFFSLLIFWLTKLSLSGARKLPFAYYFAVLPAITLLGGLGVLLFLLDRGFQTQIFAYCALTALLALLATKPAQRQAAIFTACLCLPLIILVATSWWLLLPLTVIPLYMYAREQHILKALWHTTRRFWPVSLGAAFTILYPIIINELLSQKSGQINEQGGVDRIHYTAFAYILPVIIGAIICFRGAFVRQNRILLTAIATAIGCSTLIGLYQLLTIHRFEYFYFKTLFTLYLLLVALFFICIYWFIAWLAVKRVGRANQAVGVVLILALITLLAFRTQLVNVRVYIHNWMPSVIDPGELDELFTADAEKYKDIMFFGDCVPASDYIANRWSGARLNSESTVRSEISADVLFGRYDKANSHIQQYIREAKPILIVADQRCSAKYPVLSELSTQPTVTIRYTNTH